MKPWSQKKIDLCVHLYSQGFSQDQVAKELKAGQAHVCKILKQQGIACRFAPWTKERIQRMVGFYRSGLSVAKTAQKMHANRHTVRKYLQQTGIPILFYFEATGKVEQNPNWKGGRHVGEYVYVRYPDHPHCKRCGYILEHRLVMEKHLGRHLRPGEVVHHCNGKKHDNRIDNLELFATNGEHLAAELKGRCPKWTEDGRKRIAAAHRKWCRQQRKKSRSKSGGRR